ncbi:succinyl-diaminopimelate desuccinylase [Solirubrobacter sp. CPCC 204708]|uniref:Succinyl-diaminopimelate desuccinylase n=1 Tax=Solirubrobacter deserti TaxID=2282478 RepID=A0ABT4RHL8_9ACTN|nr:succinyl-diaminopimelate desuccinylase [Solirubrobacter deserti]MBE2315305.1 succinyl-diaminopimelate desuccinylase [Solirubrobacter deserti]MDA0137990.1 succinyl-diaminopimelate desuccinylase [Solirubrobacter deserti]
MPVAPAPSESEAAERLAARTLELIDIASESRHEAALAEHVASVLRGGGAVVEDLGDSCVLAYPSETRPQVLLAGHLDTVPAQDNLPGRIEDGRVFGLGASDMKGALAVMIELVLARVPYAAVFFPREELPATESALAPLLERHTLQQEFVVVMEPTDGELHAGCLGNINATWTFTGRSAHSARPWQGVNAIHQAALGIAALAAAPSLPVDFHGLTFHEVASVTKVSGGIAMNVVPETATAHVNFRYAPGRTPAEAEARLLALTQGLGALTVDGNAPSGAVAVDHPLAQKLITAGDLHVAPKQAWTPVAEFAAAGYPAVNFGPGETAQAHQRGEGIGVDRLLHAHRVLEAFGA